LAAIPLILGHQRAVPATDNDTIPE